jgi:hypothetical protein
VTVGARVPDAGWTAAHDLANRLAEGHGLPRLTTDSLGVGEAAHVRVNAHAQHFCAAEVEYEEHGLLAFGGFALLAASAAVSAIGNRRRRAGAEAEASPQWRSLGPGGVLATNRRLVIGDPLAGVSIWYRAVRQVVPNLAERQLALHADGHHPIRVIGPWAPYLGVAVAYLVHGEVLRPPSWQAVAATPPPAPAPVRRRRPLAWLVG